MIVTTDSEQTIPEIKKNTTYSFSNVDKPEKDPFLSS